MKRPGLLNKLKGAKRLEIAEPSEEICTSYLEKANNCLLSAKILLQNNLYENSISEAYYSMYNSLTALLFRTGIKCENHAGSILLLRKVFRRNDLSRAISKAKKERIDKQYYVDSKKDFILTKEIAQEMVKTAEGFLIEMKLFINSMNSSDISRFRESFIELFKGL